MMVMTSVVVCFFSTSTRTVWPRPRLCRSSEFWIFYFFSYFFTKSCSVVRMVPLSHLIIIVGMVYFWTSRRILHRDTSAIYLFSFANSLAFIVLFLFGGLTMTSKMALSILKPVQVTTPPIAFEPECLRIWHKSVGSLPDNYFLKL